ncbi:hypothetical protein [Kibdelosporangium phytohabitans]|uniref:DUF2059 domain-containing protein n=1 Tax=Kibdelosporangium phytohabitans TaxID=860235 RepID=A0A0N9HXJ8_9PSEU|nr:hypothetical protein [Kibdelosporangium phytohabitans]ALG06608.1 hypothetical protein AOZ06_06440 [Kibdelosporangium phytohabitans]MBE1467811.1 hypothetical protein [Kibdelosporangium phytohabitans]
MSSRTIIKPIAAVVTSAILVAGFAPTAVAAAEADRVHATISAQQEDAAQRLLTTLRQAIAPERVDALAAQVTAAGDTALAAQLAAVKDAAGRVSTQDIDLVAAVKELLRFLQPVLVAALRYGGPIAAGILEIIGSGLTLIPEVGGAINDLIFKPIAALIKEWAPKLADFIEGIEIESLSADEVAALIADHLHTVEGLPAEAASFLGKGLAVNL